MGFKRGVIAGNIYVQDNEGFFFFLKKTTMKVEGQYSSFFEEDNKKIYCEQTMLRSILLFNLTLQKTFPMVRNNFPFPY